MQKHTKVQQTKVFQDRRILPSPFRYAREAEGELTFTVVGYGWLSLNEAVKVLRGRAMSDIVEGYKQACLNGIYSQHVPNARSRLC